MPYDYDAQIERLTARPELIEEEWGQGKGLFKFASPDGKAIYHGPETHCGCLTMIRDGGREAFDKSGPNLSLTNLISADERIPKDWTDITPAHLPIFKEWQVRLDREIRGIT